LASRIGLAEFSPSHEAGDVPSPHFETHRLVDLARLITPWRHAEIGADRRRAGKAGWRLDASHIGMRHERADAKRRPSNDMRSCCRAQTHDAAIIDLRCAVVAASVRSIGVRMGSSVASPSIISRTLAIYVARNFFARTYPNVFKMPRTQFSPAAHVATGTHDPSPQPRDTSRPA
jgi:hypothetical protein